MQGLATAEAEARLAQYGPNQLPEKSGDGLGLLFIRQFNSPFVYMLLVAAIFSFGLDHTINGIFILAVLLINASIGTVQEHSAQRAAAALKDMVPALATVIRDGQPTTLKASLLVPGDLVQLASGDRVPADMQLRECQSLLIDESALTGESQAVAKSCPPPSTEIPKATDNPPIASSSNTEQPNLVFAGTIVNHGRGLGEVIATGTASQLGRIATEVGEKQRIKAPLLVRIERFTLRISYAVLVVIAILFVIALVQGADLGSVFLLGVALAVSAIPEGLPAAITVALAIGMRRMARVNVIVRKLVAVESLGSCTYIASDKTGTLTVNELTIKKLLLPDGALYTISGEGTDIHGGIVDPSGRNCHLTDLQSTDSHSPDTRIPIALESLIRTGMLANEANLTLTATDSGQTSQPQWEGQGDGVDIAFLVLAAKYGFDHNRASLLYPETGRIAYESENAYSASCNRVDGQRLLHVKGSAERILPMCTRTATVDTIDHNALAQQASTLAAQGYRVLALAVGHTPDSDCSLEDQLQQLTFLGFAAMIDPLRPEAREAVDLCREAHMQVAMITGDHPQTALALARELDIAKAGSRVVIGNELAKASEEGEHAVDKLIASSHVFARIEPTQKLQIIERLIARGEFVAVTGDGVNDAPALRHAHVGVAMGKRGTDVARESSELIITDDNFASIVQGIRQGRVVYNNIRKVIFLLISTGVAEITLFILSVLFGYPIPLFPIQLLWLNLVTNGIQDVALAFEPAEGDELKRHPRPPNEPIFNRLMLQRVLINATVMGSLAFCLFAWCMAQGMDETSARNMTLLLMVLFENVHVLNSRSESRSVFQQNFFGNPLLLFGMLAAQAVHIGAMYTPRLKDILQVQPVSLPQWASLLAIALVLILVDTTHKRFYRRAPLTSVENT